MSEHPVKMMCSGCGHNCGTRCDIITDPSWIFRYRSGKCFAYVTQQRYREIEDEIRNKPKKLESPRSNTDSPEEK